MRKSVATAVAATVLSAGLLAGCAEDPEPACDKQDVVWDVEAGVYRCPDGAQWNDVDVDLKKPKAKTPKPQANPKPAAPRSSGRR